MIEETIARIENRLRQAPLSPEQRTELQELLSQLRSEAGSLPIAVTTPKPPANEDARSAVTRLQSSLTEFEASHPQLVEIVNRISTTLANMGI